MITPLDNRSISVIETIINKAAIAYKGIIPDDCWHEPYMTRDSLEAEIQAGIHFWGWAMQDSVLAVMGLQHVKDVALIRHAYVHPEHQGKGIGGKLLQSLMAKTNKRVLVGTWQAAEWAIQFYEHHGFSLTPAEEKKRLLQTYWSVPDRQIDTSVVLERDS